MRKEREKKKQVSDVAAANSLDNCEQIVPSWVISWMSAAMATIRYDTRCYFNVRSKADMSQLNLPHGTDSGRQTVPYTSTLSTL